MTQLGDLGPHVSVEYVTIQTEIARCIPEPDEPRQGTELPQVTGIHGRWAFHLVHVSELRPNERRVSSNKQNFPSLDFNSLLPWTGDYVGRFEGLPTSSSPALAVGRSHGPARCRHQSASLPSAVTSKRSVSQ